MKKFYVLVAALCICGLNFSALAQVRKGKQVETYRRSSLNMIMLEDPQSDQAISQMIRQAFVENPVPSKYNDHGVDVALRAVSMADIQVTNYAESQTALSTKKKKVDADKGVKIGALTTQLLGAVTGVSVGPSNPIYNIANMNIDTTKRWIPHVAYHYLKKTDMAKLMVDKWFGAESGKLNIDLIRERAVENATEAEKTAAEEQGDRSVEDAIMDNGGHEIVGNTFVTISRFRYLNADQLASEILENAAIGAAFAPTQIADAAMAAAELSALGTKVAMKDGYAVSTNTYLFRLVWNEEIFEQINACADDIAKYNALDCFTLEYIGSENAHATVPVKKEFSTEEAVRQATSRALEKVLAKLEKEYEVFRTKTPLTQIEPVMAAQIGTRECVEKGDKYEILEKVYNINKKTGKSEIEYKRIGVITVDEVGNNMGEENDDENASANTYTTFKGKAPKKALPGSLIRFTK